MTRLKTTRKTWWVSWVVIIAGLSAMVAEAQLVQVPRPRFGVSLGLEYTDNVDQSETDQKPDLKLTISPNISGEIDLPFHGTGGGKLALQTSASFTYKQSLVDGTEQEFDSPANINLALPMRLGGWTVTVSDAFTGIKNEPLESTVVVKEKESKEYNNTAGVTLSREFGKLGLAISIQRADTIAPSTPDTEETTYQLSLTPSYMIGPRYSVFWSHIVGLVFPKDPERSEVMTYITTVGLNGQLTQTLAGSVGIGYSHVSVSAIDSPTTNAPAQQISGLNAVTSLSYAHPLRPNTTHSMSFAYSPGITALLEDSNVQESYAAAYTLTHRLNRGLVLAPTINWNFIRDIGTGGSGEATHLIRAGFSLGGNLTDRINASLNYFYQARLSNLPEETYNAHQLTVSLSERLTAKLTGTLGYMFEIRESQSAPEENYNENTITASLSESLTQRLSGSLTYTLKLRSSPTAGDSYTENRIAISLNYAF